MVRTRPVIAQTVTSKYIFLGSRDPVMTGFLETGALDHLLFFKALDVPCLLMEVRRAIVECTRHALHNYM